RRGTGSLKQSRKMSRHRPCDEPRSGEHECEEKHLPVWLPSDCNFRRQMRTRKPRRKREQEAVERKPNNEVEHRPYQTGFAPPHRFVQKRRQRPAYGRCKAGEERYAGNRAARFGTV